MKKVAKFEDCIVLDCMENAAGGLFYFAISTDTDSVYLFKDGGDSFPAVLEFTPSSEVIERVSGKDSYLGWIKTPQGKQFGKALEFYSIDPSKFTMTYDKPHVEMFIELEKKICRYLVQDKDPEILKAFLQQNWEHPGLDTTQGVKENASV
jgi:hypothetical protein